MIRKLALSAAFLAASLGTASAATIFADNFDSKTLGLGVTPAGWTVSGGTVDVIGAGGPFDFYPGNGRYMDMDGSNGNAGRITSTIAVTFVVGQSYTLSFSYGKNGSNAEGLLFGFAGQNASISVGAGSMPAFATYTMAFTALSATGALYFEGVGGDNQGMVLDNVKISAIPLPAAAPLLLAGLGGLAMLRRRRRA